MSNELNMELKLKKNASTEATSGRYDASLTAHGTQKMFCRIFCRISAAVQILYFPTKRLCVQTAAVQRQENIRFYLREAWEDAGFFTFFFPATCNIF